MNPRSRVVQLLASFLGARTGGTNIMEGLIEMLLGIFLAASIAAIFAVFRMAIVGGMMFLVGIEIVKFARDLRWGRELVPVAGTLAGSLGFNMAIGFVVGLALHYFLLRGHEGSPHAH
jgi:MFS superfamily sulfate permease-like transporter